MKLRDGVAVRNIGTAARMADDGQMRPAPAIDAERVPSNAPRKGNPS